MKISMCNVSWKNWVENERHAIFLVMFVICFFCMNSFAYARSCCEGSAISAIKNAESTLLNRISEMQTSIIVQLQKNAADQISTTEAMRKSLLEAMQALTEEMEQFNQEIAKRQQQYETEKELDRIYGMSPETMQKICDDAKRGAAAARVAAGSTKMATERGNDVKSNWMNASTGNSGSKKTIEALSRVVSMPEDHLDVQKIEDASLKDEDLNTLIGIFVNPNPPPQISDTGRATPAGVVYQSINNERFMRESTVLGVVQEYMKQVRPEEETGKSYTQIIDESIEKTGFLSDEYRAMLQTAQAEDIIRQIIVQQMIYNQILVNRYQMALRRSILLANAVSQEVDDHMKVRLLEMRNRLATQ